MTDAHLPVVAIVGRPNVGKSALFNRIVGRRISIVHEESGVTRDRLVAPAEWEGRRFLLVDTGGLGVALKEKTDDLFDTQIREQVASVVEDAAVILWVVDAQAGPVALDHEVAGFLRPAMARVLVVANKADNHVLCQAVEAEFARLGFPRIVPVSCVQNMGIGDMLDACIEGLPAVPAGSDAVDETAPCRLAVVGRPNVGKSSLVNRLLGEERVIVSPIAGTTRDAVDIPMRLRSASGDELELILIDTAGLRQKRRVDTAVEFFSVARAEKAVRRCDMAIFVVDATEPCTAQDRRIADLLKTEYKPCIMAVNKWDLVAGETNRRDLLTACREMIPFLHGFPLETVCAMNGHNVARLIEHIVRIHGQMRITIPTPVLNRFIQDLVARTPPPAAGNRRFKVFYSTMVGSQPAHIVMFVNYSKACPSGYMQFLENQVRDAFFPGTGMPLKLELRERRPPGSTPTSGRRQAVAGIMRQKEEDYRATQRHRERHKGWRKK